MSNYFKTTLITYTYLDHFTFLKCVCLCACVYLSVCSARQTGQWPTELTGSQTANTGCQFIGHHPVPHSLCHNFSIALQEKITFIVPTYLKC